MMQQKSPKKKSPRPARQFTPEFRVGAVRPVLEEGRSQALVAKNLGLPKSVPCRWVKEARADAGKGPPGVVTSTEREDLSRLHKEVKLLRTEPEILKSSGFPRERESGKVRFHRRVFRNRIAALSRLYISF
ncbi:MAG: hypothetical protein EXR71_14105 [Myxococcales bacterium]|nr:hypothetical protein [Myxococcales bacterium]